MSNFKKKDWRKIKASDLKALSGKSILAKATASGIDPVPVRGRFDYRLGDGEILFELPFLTAGLNGEDGLIRMHFSEYKKEKERIHLYFMAQRPRAFKAISGPTECVFIRYSTRFMDWDNACASAKLVLDSLQSVGVLVDDSPKVIEEFTPIQIKCKAPECRIVVILRPITSSWRKAQKKDYDKDTSGVIEIAIE